MSEGALVSLVALLGWLVLVAGAFRAHRIGARKAIVLALIWASIFVAVAFVFSLGGT